jgi:glycine oxidase
MKINIIGGGIVGCIQAIEMKKKGFDVSIYEMNRIGSGSTNAGAGILYPLLPHQYEPDVYNLVSDSISYYLDLQKVLITLFNFDIDLIQSGMLIDINLKKDLESWLISNAIDYKPLCYKELKGIFIKDVYQINPKKLTEGIVKYLKYLNVEIFDHTEVRLNSSNEFIDHHSNKILGDKYIISSGAWTYLLIKRMKEMVYPIRGQLIEYENKQKLEIKHIIFKEGTYVFQRKNGSIIAGSTLEDVGFDNTLTNQHLEMLKKNAEDILPELSSHEVLDHWHGFRPGSKKNIPLIIKDTEIKNTYFNTGHFRYGVSMAPASVELLVDSF